MNYCFVINDIQCKENNCFQLQYNYAITIGGVYYIDLEEKTVRDYNKNLVSSLSDKIIMLRCSYDYIILAMKILRSYGAKLLENEQDIISIEKWYRFNLTKRAVIEFTISELLAGNRIKYPSIEDYSISAVFIKSLHKGFCATIKKSKLKSIDKELQLFFERIKEQYGDTILLSEYYEIRSDSLGPRESRHVVLNGQLINSSRIVHSVRHTVPKSHILKANDVVEKISRLDFPKNYVLDIGEFIKKGDSFLDIIEYNPLTCSQCYVNNSIFTIKSQEIEKTSILYRMGYEYCYDAIKHPSYYYLNRVSTNNYTYTNDNRYSF